MAHDFLGQAADISQESVDYGQDTSASHQLSSRQWTLKSLDPRVVKIARESAKRSGTKINKWITMAIIESANKIEKGGQTIGITDEIISKSVDRIKENEEREIELKRKVIEIIEMQNKIIQQVFTENRD